MAKLAIFDLDHTLLPLDTGELWVRWLLRESGRDPAFVVRTLERFTQEYRAGVLDIQEFMQFQLQFLSSFKRKFLDLALEKYIHTIIRPNIPDAAIRLVDLHRQAGDVTVICTATYRYVTEAIAKLFGVDILLASTPQENSLGEFTGQLQGLISYREGKVCMVEQLLQTRKEQGFPDFDRLYFYSDSAADLPLFEFVERHQGKNFVVNAEARLQTIAQSKQWAILNTFGQQELNKTRRIQQVLARG